MADLRNRARALRVNQTRVEARLWAALRDRRLGGWKWRRQVPLGPFIADFVCAELMLIVELDGGQHFEAAPYDARRTGYLESLGYRVLRFWNSVLIEDSDAVCDTILRACGGEGPQSGVRRPLT
ncbi:MAG: endonuclease domain-containing protein [Pseudomonadota bacterium]